MSCRYIDIVDLATDFAVAWVQAAEKVGGDAYDIRIFLRDYPTQKHMHYTVDCDQARGGTDEAEAAVRAELPPDVYCLLYDEGLFESVQEALGYACARVKQELDLYLILFEKADDRSVMPVWREDRHEHQ